MSKQTIEQQLEETQATLRLLVVANQELVESLHVLTRHILTMKTEATTFRGKSQTADIELEQRLKRLELLFTNSHLATR